VIDTMNRDEQRRRIVITAVILGAVALLFYVAAIVRFW